MDSDYFNQNNNNNSGGLLRFRSAPSSFLENYVNGVEKITPKRFCSRISIGDESKTVANKHIATVNSQLPPQYPRQNGGVLGTAKVSPPVLFSQNGYGGTTRGIGNEDIISLNRLKNNHMNLSSSLGQLSQIREVENESENGLMLFSSWNDSSIFDESFTSGLIKRELDVEHNLFTDTDQHEELENRTNILSRHLSLPKTAAEMVNMEKYLQLQDSVPCKIRAKRGCATHPRSIAERVRRTRISERMRKLQELVPNMDKQTNTSDMLDLAVDYIKNLQKQYVTLRESRANCKCMPSSPSQKTVIN